MMRQLTVRFSKVMLLGVVLFSWFDAFAEVAYVPLSGSLPGIDGSDGYTLSEVLNAIMGWSVGLAAILAVIMLAVGGFNYMTSESVFKTGDAKEKMTNAIFGLLVVLLAVFLLGYTNSSITETNLNFTQQ